MGIGKVSRARNSKMRLFRTDSNDKWVKNVVYRGHPQNGPKYGGHWNGVKMGVGKD